MDNINNAVLIIEDDPDTRATLSDVLELDGYIVEAAGNFGEAFEQRDWASLFAILLDRRLPDGTADDWLPKLRQAAPQAAIIIVTGHADLEGAINIIRHGIADFIPKPVDLELLRMTLARIHRIERAEKHTRQTERLAAVGEMVTTLSHESRNLIQRIQASVSLLKQTLVDDEQGLSELAKIEFAGDSLNGLLEEVRGYVAPIVLNREDCSIDDIWKQAWSHLSHSCQGRDVSMTEQTNGVDTTCPIDAIRIEQVFRNLFENALTASEDPGRIEVECSNTKIFENDALKVKVRDNGHGLTGELKKRIFEPFFTTKAKGTGLGMAIVKRIINAHGGSISVGDATETGGAEFVMTFPRTNLLAAERFCLKAV